MLDEKGISDFIGLQVVKWVIGIESTKDPVSMAVEQDEKLLLPEGVAAEAP